MEANGGEGRVCREGELRKELSQPQNGNVTASDSTLSFLRKALSQTTVTGTASGGIWIPAEPDSSRCQDRNR